MSFYLPTLLLAVVQSFLLLPIFSSYLYVPDLVLIALFYKLLTSEENKPLQIIVPSLFLDVLYDSLGWNVSSKILFSFSIFLTKKRFILVSKWALFITFFYSFLMEHLFRYLLLRFKYYYPFEPLRLIVCLLLEFFLILVLSNRIISKNAQA